MTHPAGSQFSFGVDYTAPGPIARDLFAIGVGVVQEPTTGSLLALGLVGIAAVGRRHRGHGPHPVDTRSFG
jgi:hypothetical protein